MKKLIALLLALVMALDRAMKNQNSGGSVYDERDMIFL